MGATVRLMVSLRLVSIKIVHDTPEQHLWISSLCLGNSHAPSADYIRTLIIMAYILSNILSVSLWSR